MPDAILVNTPSDMLNAQLVALKYTGRWTASRKAIVCELIRRGALTVPAACESYGLSAEELAELRAAEAQRGRRGLAATKIRSPRSA